jgi:hypothetical protein
MQQNKPFASFGTRSGYFDKRVSLIWSRATRQSDDGRDCSDDTSTRLVAHCRSTLLPPSPTHQSEGNKLAIANLPRDQQSFSSFLYLSFENAERRTKGARP